MSVAPKYIINPDTGRNVRVGGKMWKVMKRMEERENTILKPKTKKTRGILKKSKSKSNLAKRLQLRIKKKIEEKEELEELEEEESEEEEELEEVELREEEEEEEKKEEGPKSFYERFYKEYEEEINEAYNDRGVDFEQFIESLLANK